MMRTSLKVSRTRQTDRDVRAGFPMREEYEAVRRLACVEIFSRDDPGRVDAGSTRGCGAQSIHGDEGASGACRKSCITPPVSEQDPAMAPAALVGPRQPEPPRIRQRWMRTPVLPNLIAWFAAGALAGARFLEVAGLPLKQRSHILPSYCAMHLF
jgi:hypothetical protein